MNYSYKELKNISFLIKGGQKEVYIAEHPSLGVVIYKTGSFSSDTSLERIKREIDFLTSIQSPHFPKNYSFQADIDSKTFHIIEEHIDGATLDNEPGILSDEFKVIKFLKQILTPLIMLWEQQIVHRDLKPQNIILRNHKNIVIIDLGIARFLGLDSLTNTLNLVGPCTPFYAAPEQLRNEKSLIDERTDCFSLGIVLLEGFLGFHPFDPTHMGNKNSTIENIVAGLYVEPSSIKHCSSVFTDLFKSLLRPRQHQRFRRGGQLLEYIKANWEI